MPITISSTTEYVAEWIYDPNELVDFSKFMGITLLYIGYPTEGDETESSTDYVIPSMVGLFPNLTHLRIRNRLTVGITDLPATVVDVQLLRTSITDVSPIFRFGINLLTFSVIRNVTPISMNLPLPSKLLRFWMENTVVTDVVILPNTIGSVSCQGCIIPRLYGLENASNDLYFNLNGCITPYDQQRIYQKPFGYQNIKDIVEYITVVNAVDNYLELGSIPRRIRISTEEDLYNPIIIAMKLASNYPRRMAEFVAVTEIKSEFLPPLDQDYLDPHEMWDVDEDDDDNYYYGNDFEY